MSVFHSGAFLSQGGGGGVSDIVDDTTPQLGGDLDVNGNSIVSVSDGNINITPDGTGKVVMNKVDIGGGAIDGTPIGASSASTALFTDMYANTIASGAGLTVTEIAAPSTPAAGRAIIYAKTDGKVYSKDDAGTEYDLTVSGSSWDGEVTVNAQTGTTYTLVIGDKGKTVTMDNASANTLTVPPNSSVAFATGTVIRIIQKGTGQTTIAEGAGVTINQPDGYELDINEQNGSVYLTKIDTDTWQIEGSLEPTVKPYQVEYNDQTGTSYTPVASDAGKTIVCTNATTVTFTIPAEASVNYAVGTIILVVQGGAGDVDIDDTNVTLRKGAGSNATTAEQWAKVCLEKIGSDEWLLTGQLESA